MPVFNCFLKILKKNKLMIAVYLIIFTTCMVLFMGDNSLDEIVSFSESKPPITIIDRDESLVSQTLLSYLGSRYQLTELEDDKETLQDALYFRNTVYILYIPEGYEDSFLSGNNPALENVKLPGSASGTYIDQVIDQFVSTLQLYLSADYSLQNALEAALHNLEADTEIVLYQKNGTPRDQIHYFYNYLPYVFLLITMSALGPILMAINKEKLRKRLDASALPLRSRNFQITLGCILSALVIWLLFILLSFLWFGTAIFQASALLRILNSLIFLIIGVAFAFLAGQFIGSAQMLAAFSNIVGLGMSFLGGIFVPIDFLSPRLLVFSRFLPAYWYVKNNNLLTSGTTPTSADIQTYLSGLLIQLLFAAAIFCIGLVVSRQKKQNRLL